MMMMPLTMRLRHGRFSVRTSACCGPSNEFWLAVSAWSDSSHGQLGSQPWPCSTSWSAGTWGTGLRTCQLFARRYLPTLHDDYSFTALVDAVTPAHGGELPPHRRVNR